jgi:sulfide:quinone oxidoreductase
VPTSKAGSVAHFMLDVVVDNIVRHSQGLDPLPKFDGHANCFIESGYNKAYMIDFNYDVEPLPGTYPLPTVGPFSLLHETRINHMGKLAFRWIYWNVLLKGHDLPVGSEMSMVGKEA